MRKYEGVRDQGSSFLHRTPMLTWHRQLLCWDRQGYYIAVPHVSVDTETKTTCIIQGWPSSWATRELHCTILHLKWFSALWTASLTNLVSLTPIFIGPESDHCLPLSLTHSLTHWLNHSLPFSELFDVSLACEDGNSKLVEAVDDEKVRCILGSWGLVIKPNFFSYFKHKVSSRYWSWSSGKI